MENFSEIAAKYDKIRQKYLFLLKTNFIIFFLLNVIGVSLLNHIQPLPGIIWGTWIFSMVMPVILVINKNSHYKPFALVNKYVAISLIILFLSCFTAFFHQFVAIVADYFQKVSLDHLIFLALSLCGSYWVLGPLAKYQRELKSFIIPELVADLSNLSYERGGNIDDNSLMGSMIVPYYDFYCGEYYFRDDNLEVGVASLVKQEMVNYQDIVNRMIAKGVFFVKDFRKSLSEKVLILKNIDFVPNAPIGSLDKVKLGNAKFGKEFQVYAGDQLEAQYILENGFVQKLIKIQRALYNKLGDAGRIKLSFQNQQVCGEIDYPGINEPDSIFCAIAENRRIQDLLFIINSIKEI